MLLFFPFILINWGIGSITLSILSLIMLLFYFIKLFNNKSLFYRSSFLLYLLAIEIVSIIFWFFSAPAPRFANGIFIILFITCLLLLKSAYSWLKIKKHIKIILLIYPLFIFIWDFCVSYQNQEFIISGITHPPSPPMIERVTNSGLKLFFPQGKNSQCWNIIPSTPSYNKYLSLIGSNLDSGFCIKVTDK